MMVPPFFSIGLTAYDRVDLLRQSVSSILDQTLADFELIIGNDNPARTLTLNDIGIQDSRVRIINQPRNLGQVGNWRSLLEHATGRYFTWIADDDLYAPDFLAACHATLAAHGFPACVYSSFDIFSGPDTVVLAPTFSGRSNLVSGPDLLWGYLLDEVRLLGNMGVFARDFLANNTPWVEMERPGVALFREYLFVLLAAKLEKVAYFPDRLIRYRDHAGSWGSSNVEIEDYHSAGKWLVEQSSSMLESTVDPAVREQLVMLVFNLALKQIVSKRKNASFPVDVDGLFNSFLGLPDTSGKELGRPDAIGATHSGGRRFFLSLCRQYVVAETGRIEKEAEIRSLDAALQELRTRVSRLPHPDLIANNDISVIEAQLEEKEAVIRRHARGLEEKEAVIQTLHKAVEGAANHQRLLARGLEEKEAVIQTLRKAVEGAANNHRLYPKDLEEKDAVIQTQNEALEKAENNHRQLARGLEEKDAVIQTLHKAVKDTENKHRLLAKGFEEKDAVIQTLHKAVEVTANHHRQLARGLEEKEAVIQTLHKAVESAADNHRLYAKELEEKEAVIQELSKAVAAYRFALSVLGYVVRPVNRMVLAARFVAHRLRNIIVPRLGNLNQHAPRELRLPAHYARPVHVTQPPRISIVTPSFKQARFIERTIKSVLDQSYPNLEYHVQDGGSEDGTMEILERYADRLAGWESRPDSGQSLAINLGFARTSGEIMAWLNSDDIMLPGALAYVAAYFNQHPGIDVVYGHRILIDENDRQIGRWVMPAHDDDVLSWADYIPQETLFWRRRIWDKVGGKVDESFRFAMDWDLLVRFRAAGAKFHRLPRFLGAFRVHPHQKTSAAICDIGHQEMARIRARVLGREVSYTEIGKAILPYMLRHVATDLGYRIMNKLR